MDSYVTTFRLIHYLVQITISTSRAGYWCSHLLSGSAAANRRASSGRLLSSGRRAREDAASVFRRNIDLTLFMREKRRSPCAGANSYQAGQTMFQPRRNRGAYLHCGIYTTDSNQRKMRVAFDDIDDTAISFEDIVDFLALLVPHKPMSVVGSGDYVFIPRAKEVYCTIL